MHKQPIKLFVDAHSLDHEYQGTYTFIKELYTELLTYPGLDIYFGTAKPQHLQEVLPAAKPSNILTYKYTRPSLLRYVIDIPHYIKMYNFDYAHFQYIIPKNHPNCKHIVTLHDIIFNDYPAYTSFTYRKSREFLYARSIRNADIKTTVSAYSRDRISAFYGLDSSKISILNNGVKATIAPATEDKIAARELIAKKYGISNFILYVSRVEPRKNHALLLKTWLDLKLYEQGIALVFIGKLSIKVSELDRLISGLSPEQKKYFHQIDQVDDADLNAFYLACRVFVYPSLAEGFGIPPLEAAMRHATVLCSSATAMSNFDFFEPHMFDPADTDSFLEKLQKILSYSPGEMQLSQIAGQIQERYNWKDTARTFYQLLK